jgi:hypothetical protein
MSLERGFLTYKCKKSRFFKFQDDVLLSNLVRFVYYFSTNIDLA